jgi:hypothetical protein
MDHRRDRIEGNPAHDQSFPARPLGIHYHDPVGCNLPVSIQGDHGSRSKRGSKTGSERRRQYRRDTFSIITKEESPVFKIHDAFGIVAVVLLLILVYLILNNGKAFQGALGSFFSGTTGLAKVLQGR